MTLGDIGYLLGDLGYLGVYLDYLGGDSWYLVVTYGIFVVT